MRRITVASMAVGLALVGAPAHAEVVASTDGMMEISQQVTIDKPVAEVWTMLRAPQKWWDKEHTYSGDSANLYLDAQATGCFCEKLPGKGSVEHGHIVYIQPPQMIRLQTSLGPLQAEAVTGTLTFKLDAEGSNATRLTLTYLVSGFVHGGVAALAPKVDEVLATQIVNLKGAAEAAVAPPADK